MTARRTGARQSTFRETVTGASKILDPIVARSKALDECRRSIRDESKVRAIRDNLSGDAKGLPGLDMSEQNIARSAAAKYGLQIKY